MNHGRKKKAAEEISVEEKNRIEEQTKKILQLTDEFLKIRL